MERHTKKMKLKNKEKKKLRQSKIALVQQSGVPKILDRQKNKFRGIIGQAHSHAHINKNRDVRIKGALRGALSEARYELPMEMRDQLFQWLSKAQFRGNISLSEEVHRGLSHAVLQTRPTSLEDELAWCGKLIERNAETISRFVVLSEGLDAAFWSGDWGTVRSTLDVIHKEMGESIWLINAEIALRQHFEGLESQKSYSANIKNTFKNGFPAYVSYYSSIRNEEGSTYFLFEEDFKESLLASKVDQSVKDYLIYKISGEHDLSNEKIAATLRFDQGLPIVDLYESIIDLFQRRIAYDLKFDHLDSVIRFIEQCAAVEDFRLQKLSMLIGKAFSDPNDDGPPKIHRGLHADFWNGIWPMLLTPDVKHVVKAETNSQNFLHDSMQSLIQRDQNFDESRASLVKFSRNFTFIRAARSAGDFADFVTLRSKNLQQILAKTALNSRGRDRLGVIETAEFVDGQLFHPTAGVTREILTYIQALRLAPTHPDEARAELKTLITDEVGEGLANLARNLDLQIALDEGEATDAIKKIGKELARRPSTINALPAQAAIGDRTWESLSSIDDKLALSLCLYAHWKQTDDSLRTTHLRFSFEEVLDELGVGTASEITPELAAEDPKVRFFLAHVCIPALMDNSGLFGSTDELLNERLAILTKLMQIDADNYEAYIDEATLIRANRLIKSGLEIVDSNRITVDTDALTRWAVKRYREGFNRYKTLRSAGIGSSDKIEQIFEKLKIDPENQGESFTIPDNEADTLFQGILLAVRDRFVGDEQYGLEYFLGKRIRHGTVSGHLRGPAENAKLITERQNPSKPYEPNRAWMSRLSFKNAESEMSAQAAFSNFSEKYDEIIASVRDKYLHVKSKSHPDGLLQIPVDAVRYQIIRSIVIADVEFENFLQAYFAILWNILEASLSSTRQYLTSIVKNDIDTLYGTLLESLRAETIQNDEFVNLSGAIQTVRSQVHRELDVVGDWFVKTDSQNATHMFSLDDVLQVSIQSALKTLPNFRPNIHHSVKGRGVATTIVLLYTVDIVFIVIENAMKHSRMGVSPDIFIDFEINSDLDVLTLKIRNPVNSELDSVTISQKLLRIRQKIEDDDIAKSAAVEGESGLLKIANIVRSYTDSKLHFDIFDGWFETIVEFPIVYLNEKISLAPQDDEK